jgi:hypothetical protein
MKHCDGLAIFPVRRRGVAFLSVARGNGPRLRGVVWNRSGTRDRCAAETRNRVPGLNGRRVSIECAQ